MASLVPLHLTESNDETINLTAISPIEVPVASCTFELYIKTSANQPDDDATILTTGSGLTISTTGTTTTIGLIADIPAAALAAPGEQFWRLDLIITGKRHTCMYGPLTVRNV